MQHRALGVMLGLALATGASAEERFYPIVGPDGSIRVIRGDAPVTAPPPAANTSAKASPASPSPSTMPVPPASPAAAAPAPADGVSFAPYDSGEYADSEAVDQAARSEERKRFYLINDGLGQQRLAEGGVSADTEPAPATPAAEAERYEPLPAALREVDRAAGAARYPVLAACQAAAKREAMAPLEAGRPAGLVLDKRTYTFLDASQVVASYRVGGEGLRTVALRSYSRKDRAPAFAHPDLAFLDASGCLTRLVSGYYERFYAATEQRHPMLAAELAVHADESYLLVLAPAGGAGHSALPFAPARVGQLKFTLKK